MLERLQLAGLKLKPEKCKFAQPEVCYLGHNEGVCTDPGKLRAVSEFPIPDNVVKSLGSFLGLASYYQRYIPQFGRIVGPLYTLTKKDVEFI